MNRDESPEWRKRLLPESTAQIRRARRTRLAIIAVASGLLGSVAAIIVAVGIEYDGQAVGLAVAASLAMGAVGFAAGSLR